MDEGKQEPIDLINLKQQSTTMQKDALNNSLNISFAEMRNAVLNWVYDLMHNNNGTNRSSQNFQCKKRSHRLIF